MIHKTIKLYEDRDDVILTTYILDDSAELLKGKKRPAVIICPGGGYIGCSDREAEPVALQFNVMGYHAFVLRYSTYGNGKSLPDMFGKAGEEVNPNSVHPGPVRDIGRAFLELHVYADEWLVDMEKIAICGFSAGGHNCAMYSVYWDKPLIYEHFGEDVEKFRPAAAILAYAICDYHLMVGDITDPALQALSHEVSIAFLGTKTPSSELLDEVSPTLHVSDSTPPTFLWATAEDELVPVENTTRMATALAAAGIPFEVHVYEQGGHGLSLSNQATGNSLSLVNPEVETWIKLVEAWLVKRFALPLAAQM